VLLATAQGSRPTLTLDSALQTAFANNPDLAAAQEIDIAGGGRQQAGLIPNPVASWDAEDTPRHPHHHDQTQPDPRTGRGARIDLATRVQDTAALTLEQRRNTLRVEVIDNYYGALRAQERLDLAQRSLALAERGLVVANGRVTAGKSSPVEKPPGPRCNCLRSASNSTVRKWA
jgi:cobalt-zinc-cadmium efflux system outer membrane protein